MRRNIFIFFGILNMAIGFIFTTNNCEVLQQGKEESSSSEDFSSSSFVSSIMLPTVDLSIDNFNDGNNVNLLGGGNGQWGTAGSYYYDTSHDYNGNGACVNINYNINTGDNWLAYNLALASSGTKDISSYASLSFYIKKSSDTTNDVYFRIGIKKDASFESLVDIDSYDAITDLYKKITIPLTDFNGSNLTICQFVFFKFEKNEIIAKGAAQSGVVYIDDAVFECE